MIFAGCDIGALTAKAVVIKNDSILGSEIIAVRADAVQSATQVMDRLLGKLDLSYSEIDYCVSTGYGRDIVPFAQDNMSEISCHSKGACWLLPGVRTIIDGGGQDYKTISAEEGGVLKNFRMTDKCDAGTGRSLEVIAESLGIDICELGPLSLRSTNPVFLNQSCSVLVEIEIKRLILKGIAPADIAKGIIDSIAYRILSLLRGIDIKKDITLTGGIAKNAELTKRLEQLLKTEIVELPENPQLVGAIGAAIFAAEKAK